MKIDGCLYGMRLRPYSIGCQPKGATLVDDKMLNELKGMVSNPDIFDDYHDLLLYDWPLDYDELIEYELDFIGDVYVTDND